MSEGFREWGDYGAEERWQNLPPIKKLFSFRTLKRILKILCIVILCVIYGLLAYRLITGLNIPAAATKMLWTDSARAAYDKNGGNLAVYSQEPESTFADDGRFSVYEMKFIPETNELQLTIRYNRATVKALKEDILKKFAAPDGASSEEAAAASALAQRAVDEVDDEPFAFVLRDDKGRLYTSYTYSAFEKGLYTYVRLSFEGVALFDTDISPADHGAYSPDEKYSGIIYKGANKSDEISSDISYLYLDFYYENDVKYESGSWADSLFVYKSSMQLSKYDISKDAPKSDGADKMIHVDIKESE